MTLRTRCILLAFSLLCCVRLASAQDETPTRVNSQNRTGNLPFSTTVGSGIEHVDVATGNLIVNIPIVSTPGRGMDYQFGLTYNALFWISAHRLNTNFEDQAYWNIELRPASLGLGWTETRPAVTGVTRSFDCTTLSFYQSNFIYQDANGTKHPLAVQKSTSPNCPIDDSKGPDLTGEGMWSTGGTFAGEYVFLSDGTRFNGSTWRDSNGNLKDGVTDTLGRQVVVAQSGSNQYLYKVYDSNGTQQTYTINFGTINLATAFNEFPNAACGGNPIQEFSSSRQVITSIVLPNGTAYQFQYENGSYGALTRIDLPTGGYITYTWTTEHNLEKTHRRVASRTVFVGDQSYTWSFNGTTVTDPANNDSVYLRGLGDAITSAKFYSGTATTGTLLRQYDIDYVTDTNFVTQTGDPWFDSIAGTCADEPQPVALRPIRITTTLDGGKKSKIEFDYDTFTYNYHPFHTSGGGHFNDSVQFTTTRGNVTEIREFGYGQGAPGSLIRKTTRSYWHSTHPNYAPGQNNNPVYNIVDKVLAETVYDNANVQKARTEYVYDGTSLVSATGAPQHDSTYSTSLTVRGNPTLVSRWRDTPAPAGLLSTAYSYDTLGNIRTITNPRSYSTTFTYDDQWANTGCAPPSNSQAYVTEIANALGQRVRRSYYPCTGLLRSRKDENDILNLRGGTTHVYDLMGRLTQTDFSDGGQTTVAYSDDTTPSTFPFHVTNTTKINGTQNLVTNTELDKLGRARLTRLSDPQGDIYTRTEYDGFGQVIQSWNPTRCNPDNPTNCTETTYGVTTSVYDALGRVTQVIPPDGTSTANYVGTDYSANQTTVTDQAGKARRSITDALGRITNVIEDPFGVGYGTTYDYDVLGNLITVTQGVSTTQAHQTRSFTYDSLSQLLSAANPESGTVQYNYDNNGNLQKRTDQRGTQTVYGFDSLDRITSKTYTIAGTTSATPNVQYDYDSLSNSCNSKGRLVSVSSSASTTSIGCYDAIGRPTQTEQVTQSTHFPLSYGYDLAGNLVSEQYPSGKIVNTTIDGAGRVSKLQRQDSTYYAGEGSIQYAPHGAPLQMKLGNGLWEEARYNNRLQPLQMGLGQASTTLTQSLAVDATHSNRLLLEYGYGTTVNNGNLTAQTIRIQTTTTFSQTYGYDALNRLLTASEGSNWSQTYGYDRYGNRWVSAGANYGSLPSLTPTSETAYTNAGADTSPNNRILASGYDSSGNQTSDVLGRTFAYDAENHQVSFNVGDVHFNTTYQYDGDGRRISKFQNGVTTVFVYGGTGKLAAEYTNGTVDSGGPRYLIGDHLGSNRIVTSSTGNVVARHDYLPFGDEIGTTVGGRSSVTGYVNADGTRQKFTSKERDAESGLDYFLARYYSGAQGRFTSSDPRRFPHDVTDPQGWNKYEYSRNNPLRYVDLDGADFWDFINGIRNAVNTNAVAGLGRQTGNSDFRLGQKVGDGISIVGGVIEVLGGGSTAASGTVSCGTGVLCIAGAPAALAGSAVAMHGAATVGTATAHLMKNNGEETTSSKPEGEGGDSKAGAQDKKLSASEVDSLENSTGQTAHDIKADALGTKKNLSRYDLYKTSEGEIVVKPKGSSGPGESTGYTVEQLNR